MNPIPRKFDRLGETQELCVVKLGLEESVGVVIDESTEEVRIGGLNLMMLVADQKVTLEYNDDAFSGRCCSIARDPNGRFQIGVFREIDVYPDICKSMLVNSFIRIHDNNIVCLPIALVGDDQIRIRLMDGKEFVVQRNQTNQLTRNERISELQKNDNLQDIIHVYSMMNSPVKLLDIDAILIQEFGPPIQPVHVAREFNVY